MYRTPGLLTSNSLTDMEVTRLIWDWLLTLSSCWHSAFGGLRDVQGAALGFRVFGFLGGSESPSAPAPCPTMIRDMVLVREEGKRKILRWLPGRGLWGLGLMGLIGTSQVGVSWPDRAAVALGLVEDKASESSATGVSESSEECWLESGEWPVADSPLGRPLLLLHSDWLS